MQQAIRCCTDYLILIGCQMYQATQIYLASSCVPAYWMHMCLAVCWHAAPTYRAAPLVYLYGGGGGGGGG